METIYAVIWFLCATPPVMALMTLWLLRNQYTRPVIDAMFQAILDMLIKVWDWLTPTKEIEPEKVYDLRPLEEKVQEIVDARGRNPRLVAEAKDLKQWQDYYWDWSQPDDEGTVYHNGKLGHSTNETCYICERNDNGIST